MIWGCCWPLLRGKCALPEQFTISITPLCTSCRHPPPLRGLGLSYVFFHLTLFWMVLLNASYGLFVKKVITETTFNNGSLGSRIDEERSEMRYVVWIAEFSESSNLWTQLALFGIPKSMPVWVSWKYQPWLGFSALVLAWIWLFAARKSRLSLKVLAGSVFETWFDLA